MKHLIIVRFCLFIIYVGIPNYLISLEQSQSSVKPTHISKDMYIVSAADETYFPWLLHLIGSIHKVNFNELNELAIFDLGFTKDQRQYLESIEKVKVYDLELTHPDLLKHFKTNNQGKMVRGWYAWKAVAIKQALDRFPYILYVDAGCTILQPLNNLFNYIQEHDYFLLQDQVWFVGVPKQFLIGEQSTAYVINKFNLKSADKLWVLHRPNIVAGVQGLTRNMYQSYVLPMYELTKDLANFADDGSSKFGFGWARHDQILFSIHARLLHLDLIETHKDIELEAAGTKFTVRCGDNPTDNPIIFYNCKGQKEEFVKDIRFKNC